MFGLFFFFSFLLLNSLLACYWCSDHCGFWEQGLGAAWIEGWGWWLLLFTFFLLTWPSGQWMKSCSFFFLFHVSFELASAVLAIQEINHVVFWTVGTGDWCQPDNHWLLHAWHDRVWSAQEGEGKFLFAENWILILWAFINLGSFCCWKWSKICSFCCSFWGYRDHLHWRTYQLWSCLLRMCLQGSTGELKILSELSPYFSLSWKLLLLVHEAYSYKSTKVPAFMMIVFILSSWYWYALLR